MQLSLYFSRDQYKYIDILKYKRKKDKRRKNNFLSDDEQELDYHFEEEFNNVPDKRSVKSNKKISSLFQLTLLKLFIQQQGL